MCVCIMCRVVCPTRCFVFAAARVRTFQLSIGHDEAPPSPPLITTLITSDHLATSDHLFHLLASRGSHAAAAAFGNPFRHIGLYTFDISPPFYWKVIRLYTTHTADCIFARSNV